VPDAAVAVGSILALVSVLALLGFIQGVATLMVADEVIRRVRAAAERNLDEPSDLEDVERAFRKASDALASGRAER
jgi:uncharacterized membrane protein